MHGMALNRLQANLLLLLAAMIWGFSFVAQRIGMDHVGPFTFNAVRFALGGGVLLPFVLWRHRGGARQTGAAPPLVDSKLFRGAAFAGLFLFLGISFQQIGIVYTTAGKAGFITGLYVVFVPLLGLFWRQKTGSITWLAVFVAATGMYLLCIKDHSGLEKGDLLVLIGAFFWAGHVLILGWLSPRLDSFWLAMLQFLAVSLLSAVGALAFESPNLTGVRQAGIPILYAGILSVGVAFTLQVIAQKTARPTHAAVILSLEAAFAALGGWIILSEGFSLRAIVGCVLMFAGMILAQFGKEPKLNSPNQSGP